MNSVDTKRGPIASPHRGAATRERTGMLKRISPEHPTDRTSSSSLIGVLTNCGSDRNRRAPERISRLLERKSNVFHFELTKIADIPQALAMFAHARVTTIVVNGGDGTVQAVLSSLINDRPFAEIPPIAVLPGGKTNMIAADLGLRGGPERQLRRLLKRLAGRGRSPRLVERRLIALQVGDEEPPRFGMFFGTAGVVNGLRWCRTRVHPLNLPTWASHFLALGLLVLITITRHRSSPLRSQPIRMHLDGGEVLSGRYAFVLATTLDRLLLGLRPYGREGRGILKFSAVSAGGGAMLRALLALFTGRFSKGGIDGLQVRRTDSLRIEGDDPVTLDGEIYYPLPGHPITLTGRECLTFLKL